MILGILLRCYIMTAMVNPRQLQAQKSILLCESNNKSLSLDLPTCFDLTWLAAWLNDLKLSVSWLCGLSRLRPTTRAKFTLKPYTQIYSWKLIGHLCDEEWQLYKFRMTASNVTDAWRTHLRGVEDDEWIIMKSKSPERRSAGRQRTARGRHTSTCISRKHCLLCDGSSGGDSWVWDVAF